jgi:fluoride exporter
VVGLRRSRASVPPQHTAGRRHRLGGPPLRSLALVAAGGAVGAVARVALAQRFPTAGDAYPWTTFAENVGGAFGLALVLTLLAERLTTDRAVRLFLCTGALGAFTTYSTFAHELAARLLGGHLLVAAAYAAASLLAGLVAAVAGARAARSWPWIRRGRTGRRQR